MITVLFVYKVNYATELIQLLSSTHSTFILSYLQSYPYLSLNSILSTVITRFFLEVFSAGSRSSSTLKLFTRRLKTSSLSSIVT